MRARTAGMVKSLKTLLEGLTEEVLDAAYQYQNN